VWVSSSLYQTLLFDPHTLPVWIEQEGLVEA
jgi:hypothetical protein